MNDIEKLTLICFLSFVVSVIGLVSLIVGMDRLQTQMRVHDYQTQAHQCQATDVDAGTAQ